MSSSTEKTTTYRVKAVEPTWRHQYILWHPFPSRQSTWHTSTLFCNKAQPENHQHHHLTQHQCNVKNIWPRLSGSNQWCIWRLAWRPNIQVLLISNRH